VQDCCNVAGILAEGVCTPGQPCRLVLDPRKGPYYILKVRIVTAYGVPVKGAEVELIGEVTRWFRETTDDNGAVAFTCVRPGTYTLRAFLGEEEIMPPKTIEVKQSAEVEIALEAKPVNVTIALVTIDSRPYEAYWSLESAEGLRFDSGGRPTHLIEVENLPPGIYEVRVVIPGYEVEYRFGPFTADGLAGMKSLTLPIADTRFRFRTPEGRPVPGYLVRLCLLERNICLESMADENGEALFVSVPHNRLYNVSIFYRGALSIFAEEIWLASTVFEFEVSEPESPPPEAPEAPEGVPEAPVTHTITHTVTTTREVTTTVTWTVVEAYLRETTSTVTKTVTVEKVVEREVLPALPIMVAIIVAGAIIAVAIALTRLRGARASNNPKHLFS